MVNEPLAELSFVLNSLQSAIASAERVFEIIDEEEDIPNPENSRSLTKPSGDIAFLDVVFGYITV